MSKIRFFFNRKNIEFNFDKFGRNNKILYVTGLSGSGKTSTSIELASSSFISMVRRIKRHYRLDKKNNKKGFFKKHIWKLLNDSKRLHFKDFRELNEFLKKCEKNQRDDKI